MAEKLIQKWPRERSLKLREIIGRIDFCGCGTDAHWEIARELLREAASNMIDRTSFCRDRWIEFAAKALEAWGLLEHGTSISFAWLTEDGKLLLDFLNDFGTEDYDMNTGAGQPDWSAEFSWDEKDDPADTYSEWRASLAQGEGQNAN